jgi:hypothetical protein
LDRPPLGVNEETVITIQQQKMSPREEEGIGLVAKFNPLAVFRKVGK